MILVLLTHGSTSNLKRSRFELCSRAVRCPGRHVSGCTGGATRNVVCQDCWPAFSLWAIRSICACAVLCRPGNFPPLGTPSLYSPAQRLALFASSPTISTRSRSPYHSSIIYTELRLYLQAVGPVAVTSLLLGHGLGDAIDGPIQANPNTPVNQKAQDEYNHAAIQVLDCCTASALMSIKSAQDKTRLSEIVSDDQLLFLF